jgi:hypothetical protein
MAKVCADLDAHLAESTWPSSPGRVHRPGRPVHLPVNSLPERHRSRLVNSLKGV